MSKLEFTDSILDNVHGFVKLTKAESKIIELPIFKRLQGIKQLSLVSWIFPGSEHTRFSHSIGVMHIAGKIAEHLLLSEKEIITVRIAGLLHDIGHYPFSHLFEKIYMNDVVIDKPENYIKSLNTSTKGRIDKFLKDVPKTGFMAINSKKFHHECIGAEIIQNSEEIKRILSHFCPDVLIDDIINIITGQSMGSRNDILAQIIHSEIDADGMDYMLRDALFSGTSFGSFELDQLIRNLVLAEKDGMHILGIKPHGIAAADHYLINKFFTYTQVINNKHTMIFDSMAEIVGVVLLNYTKSFPEKSQLMKLVRMSGDPSSDYLKFKDEYFWNALYDFEKNNGFAPQYMKTIAQNLLLHKELEYVEGMELRIVDNDRENLKQRIESSELYKSMENDPRTLTLFGERSFTKHVPQDEVLDKAERSRYEHGEKNDQEYIKKMWLLRLQEGMAVIDKEDDDIHLLCDDHRSLMRVLYKTKFVVLRKYMVS